MKLLWGLSEKGVHEVLVAIPPHYATWYFIHCTLVTEGFPDLHLRSCLQIVNGGQETQIRIFLSLWSPKPLLRIVSSQ